MSSYIVSCVICIIIDTLQLQPQFIILPLFYYWHGPILGGEESTQLWQNATFEKSQSKGYHHIKLYQIHMPKTGYSIALSRLKNQVLPPG